MAITEETIQGERERGMTVRCRAGIRYLPLLVMIAAMLVYTVIPVLAVDTEGAVTNPTVVVASYEVSPAVLLPGDQGTVTMTLMNTAETASVKENTGITSGGVFATTKNTDINVFIERVHLEGNGIRVLTEDFDRLGEIGPGQSLPVTFVIQAPDKDGIYFPEAWIDVKNGRSTRYPVTVNVNTDIATQKKPSLSVYRVLPLRVAPGEDCTALVTIANTGLARASDITVDVNSSTRSLVLTTPGRYSTDRLGPGEMMNLTLGFATDKNTPLGIDPVTLSITYHNPDGTTGRQTETLGIPVKGRAGIALKSFATDPVRPEPGSPFTLVARIENTGTDRATSVRVVLDSPFTGTTTAFIGSIDKDSDAPAVFYLQDTKDESVPVNLTISYTDDFGNHEVTEQATVTTRQSLSPVTIAAALLLLCAMAGGAYWYFRVRPVKKHGE